MRYKKLYCKDCGKLLAKYACYHKTKRCHSCSTKKQLKNPKNHPMFGRRGESCVLWKGGVSFKKTYCVDCKKLLNINAHYYNTTRCGSCSAKKRLSNPKNNPNYVHGKHRKPYPSEFSNELKELMRKRDQYICMNCGVPQKECLKKLAVHHIDYDKKNNDTINLIALCNKCNVHANYNRKYWQNYYENIQIERNVHLLEKEF